MLYQNVLKHKDSPAWHVECVPWHSSILGLVNLCVGIAQLNCDVALKLVLEADSLYTTDGFHHC